MASIPGCAKQFSGSLSRAVVHAERFVRLTATAVHHGTSRPPLARMNFLGRRTTETKLACADRLMPRMRPPCLRPPTDQTFTCKTHSGAPRLSGAALAAMREVLTLSVCKRRDAVRLGTSEAARPPGAAFGVLSGATAS
jgi:hypothetical protein